MSNPDKPTKKFLEGDRVKLKANPAEGMPEERGTVDSSEVDNGTMMVRVDKKYRGEGDDGLREVSLDQMVRLKSKKKPVDRLAAFLRKALREGRDYVSDEFNFNALDFLKQRGVRDCAQLSADELLQHPVVRKELESYARWILRGVKELAKEEDLDGVEYGPR